jgi:predicted metalloprotease
MIFANSLRARVAAAAVFAAAMLAPIAAAGAASPTKNPTIEVTRADIAASNQKLAGAYSALVDMWNKDFKQIGQQFVAPHIARYEGDVDTPCGVIDSNNAEYCSADNTIFYDEVFVAGMAKSAAQALGTDGDMAGIGIIAHEMGHAVAMQLGYHARDSYTNESTADCLAGAFAKQAQRDGSLEQGDVEEALYGMSLAGDPVLQPTGNRRMDAMLQRRLARESHGTKEQRQDNFRTGFSGGAKACLSDFTPIS